MWGSRVTLRIQLQRTVLIEHEKADREKLKDLARIILVRIRFRTSGHVEVMAHRRAQCHFLEQLAVVSERIAAENLVVCDGVARLLDADAGRHKDLSEHP